MAHNAKGKVQVSLGDKSRLTGASRAMKMDTRKGKAGGVKTRSDMAENATADFTRSGKLT